MNRPLPRLALLTAAMVAGSGGLAVAQQYYPPGYGGYGWNGWGGATVAGSTAAGMGAFAAGAGERNVEDAQARSVNAQTAEQVNEYRYAYNQRTASQYEARQAAKQGRNNREQAAIHDRILNNPNEEDIASGETLNALLLEITSPKIYPRTLQMARMPLRSSMVKRIPFRRATACITYSIADLTNPDGVPAVFGLPAFAEQRKVAKALAEQLHEEAMEQQDPKPETLKKFRATLDGARATLEALTGVSQDDQRQGERYLKAVYGLTRMIDSPSYDVYLAAVDGQPSVPLSDVLSFMHAFNLTFGASKDPETREMYSQIYGMFTDLRQGNPAPPAPGPPDHQAAMNFYGGMSYDHARGPAGAPPPPRPGGPP